VLLVLLVLMLAAAPVAAREGSDETGPIALDRTPSDPADRPSAREPPRPDYLPQKPGGAFTLPPLQREPAGAQRILGPEIEVRAFRFEGNTAFSDAELQRIAAPYAGRPVTGAELEALRHQLTRLYVDRGYINSGAIIPQGALQDGQLLVRIVEGRLQAVRLTGMQRLHEDYVRGRLVRGAGPLDVNALQENFQLLLADPLFTKMDARLLPGSEPGLAILDVDVTRALPYQFSAFANNVRPPSIGEKALGMAGWVRNLTELGDLLEASAQNNPQAGSSPRYALNWNVPLATPGTQAQLRLDHGRSSVIEEPIREVDIRSILDSREFGITQTLLEDLRRKLSLGLAYARRENTTTLLGERFSFIPGEPTGFTRILVWRFSQDYVQRLQQQVLALRSTFSSGTTNVPQSADPAVAAVQPAPRFLAWLGQAQYARRFSASSAQLLLRGDVQWAHDRLLPLERMALGGVNTVRGYRENEMVRDNGLRLSVDYQHPVLGGAEQPTSLTIGPIADYGVARNLGEASDRIASAGVGLHGRWKRLSVDFYAAVRFVSVPAPAQTSLQDKGIHFEIRYDAF
jgi:hemolysin activation/secretion protein